MWVSRAEMRRLLRDLSEWKARAGRFESLYVEERAENRRHEDGLINRLLTAKAHVHGIDERGAAQDEEESERKDSLTPEQLEMRDFYIESAKSHGKHESEGVAAFEAYMRGEPMPFELQETQ